MNPKRELWGATFQSLLVMLCAVALVPGDTLAYMPSPQRAQASSPENQAPKIPAEQLDSLVAPIALYPDPLLAQVLAASTYPLEIILLQQWLTKNSGLKDKALADAVAKQPWDPSIQALAALPDVVKRLADDIQWTTDLGNAFLAQQSDVMDAVQRMRKKAQDKGNLKSNEQQVVETKVIESKPVIVVEQANPQVVYVPTYDPVVVYGPPVYPYPPIYYPPAWYYPAGMAISFGVGVAMGAFWGGGWCCGCGWGGGDITINRNNSFNRNAGVGGGNRVSNLPARGGGNVGGNAGTDDSTIRSIAAAPHIGTELLQTGLAVRRVETPWPTARLAPGNRLAGRGAICPAIGLAAVASPTGPAAAASAIGLPAEPALATGLAGAERIG